MNVREKLSKQIEISKANHAGKSCIPLFVCHVFQRAFSSVGNQSLHFQNILSLDDTNAPKSSDSTIWGPGKQSRRIRLKQKGIGLNFVSSKHCFSLKLNSWQSHCTNRVKVQNNYKRTNKIKSPFEQWQHSIIVSMLLLKFSFYSISSPKVSHPLSNFPQDAFNILRFILNHRGLKGFKRSCICIWNQMIN